MTSFTEIDELETPRITVYPSHRISKINPNIYAGFTEYRMALHQKHVYNELTVWQTHGSMHLRGDLRPRKSVV